MQKTRVTAGTAVESWKTHLGPRGVFDVLGPHVPVRHLPSSVLSRCLGESNSSCLRVEPPIAAALLMSRRARVHVPRARERFAVRDRVALFAQAVYLNGQLNSLPPHLVA